MVALVRECVRLCVCVVGSSTLWQKRSLRECNTVDKGESKACYVQRAMLSKIKKREQGGLRCQKRNRLNKTSDFILNYKKRSCRETLFFWGRLPSHHQVALNPSQDDDVIGLPLWFVINPVGLIILTSHWPCCHITRALTYTLLAMYCVSMISAFSYGEIQQSAAWLVDKEDPHSSLGINL